MVSYKLGFVKMDVYLLCHWELKSVDQCRNLLAIPWQWADLLLWEVYEDATLAHKVLNHFHLLGLKLRIAHLSHYTFENTLLILITAKIDQTHENILAT